MYTGKRKLCIGYYLDDGYNKPIPAVERAVEMTKQVLQAAGHQLIPFKVPNIAKAMDIYTAGKVYKYFGSTSCGYLDTVFFFFLFSLNSQWNVKVDMYIDL